MIVALIRVAVPSQEPYAESFINFCRWLRRRSAPMPGRENLDLVVPGAWRKLRPGLNLRQVREEAARVNALLTAAERPVRIEYEQRLVPATELGTLPLWFV